MYNYERCHQSHKVALSFLPYTTGKQQLEEEMPKIRHFYFINRSQRDNARYTSDANTKGNVSASLLARVHSLFCIYSATTRNKGRGSESAGMACLLLFGQNVNSIWSHAFSEMINNVMDHSQAEKVKIMIEQYYIKYACCHFRWWVYPSKEKNTQSIVEKISDIEEALDMEVTDVVTMLPLTIADINNRMVHIDYENIMKYILINERKII